MQQLLGLLAYGLILIFGVLVSMFFAGVRFTSRIRCGCLLFILMLLCVQIVCWWVLGLDITQEIYPFIVHIPLALFLALFCKVGWLKSAVSVLSAYLCCQIPRWMAAIVLTLTDSMIARHIGYSLAILLTIYLLRRYVASPVEKLMDLSRRSMLLLGAVPLLYYLFDYATTVYTDLLYSGAAAAVQFFPSVVSVFFFVFVIIYYGELRRRSAAEQERMLLSVHAQQAERELDSYRRSAEQAAVYRHDMRHHLAILSGFLKSGNTLKAEQYIESAVQDLEAITPERFCENTSVNLILSFFSERAKKLGLTFSASADIPADPGISGTELCALLSNSLENAVNAASLYSGSARKLVRLSCQNHKGNLLILIRNPYDGEISMKNGRPQSDREGHGFGIKSIGSIVERHGGVLTFDATDGVFTLKAMLPVAVSGQ